MTNGEELEMGTKVILRNTKLSVLNFILINFISE